jgi:Bcr/CflA subfamily drug resistance transporter
MTKQQQITLFPYIIIFLEIAVYLSNDMYLPSMPAIGRDLDLTQDQIQSTLTLWFLGASSLQFILGPISDCYGRKIVLLIGGVLFITSSAVCALAESLPLLLAARFIQGSTICAVLVAGYAAIHELFDTKQAIKILALMNAITILAPAFGPLLGALIVQFTSWRNVFWFLTGFGILALIPLALYMPETIKQRHPLNIHSIVHGYLKILTNKEFILPTVSYCLLVAIFFVWMFEAPFLMMETYGYSNVYYGVAQLLIFGCFFVGAELTNLMLRYLDLAKLVKTATLVSLAGTVLFALTAKFLDSMPLSIVCMMIIATGTSTLFGPINRLAIEASTQPMGKRTAVFSTALSLFGALTGWVLSVVQADSLALVATLIIGCMGLATVTLLLTRVPLLPQE